MEKDLNEMTNEELWALFPIILTTHEPAWAARYGDEKRELLRVIGEDAVRINHIGSTSVAGLIAKPTIDILLEIRRGCDTARLIDLLKECGYIYSYQPDNPAPHMMFMKGYTPRGFAGQAFHLHVRYPGDWDELYFRDYLKAHSDAAEEYGKLKLQLKEAFKHDRDGYTAAKTDFITACTQKARGEFPGKYAI